LRNLKKVFKIDICRIMNMRRTIFEILVEIANFFLGFKDGFVVEFEPFDQDAFAVVDKIARIQKTLVEVEFFR